jgi:PilZ domain
MPERGREQRKSKRTQRRNAAWIVLSRDGARIPCVLWDISDGGARIAAARASALPDVFCLLLTANGKSRYFCRVVWRKNGQIGVAFIDQSAADLDFEPTPRYARQRSAAAAPPPQPARPHGITAAQLVLPGCGPQIAFAESRGLAISSIAFGMLIVLVAATALFAFAGMQSDVDAPWALAVCESTANFCQHPEWVGGAGALMGTIYLATKGMEL